MATLQDLKTQLATIEQSLGVPLSDLDMMISSEEANIQATIGAEVEVLQTQLDDLQNELDVKQQEYDTAMNSLDGIRRSKKMVSSLKEMLGSV